MIAKSLILAVLLAAPASAAEPRLLLEPNEQAVTFKLKNKEGKTPSLLLFDDPDQEDTAASVNFWRGTPNAENNGVVVEFKGLRFLRSEEFPDELIVRLVGIKNELELPERIALADVQSGKPLKFHFGPVAIGAAIITGTTDAVMELTYDPIKRALTIPEVSGSFAWKRVFYDEQQDEGSLTDVTGEVGDLPAGTSILKAPEEE